MFCLARRPDVPMLISDCPAAFTEEGVGAKVEKKDEKTGAKIVRKVMRKIPASVIRQAKGLIIFSSMRNGIMPFGGAGGSGV